MSRATRTACRAIRAIAQRRHYGRVRSKMQRQSGKTSQHYSSSERRTRVSNVNSTSADDGSPAIDFAPLLIGRRAPHLGIAAGGTLLDFELSASAYKMGTTGPTVSHALRGPPAELDEHTVVDPSSDRPNVVWPSAVCSPFWVASCSANASRRRNHFSILPRSF
ncbi:hypothetical protein DOTSEDRAFT_34800 [Dothistroma septosporum NZE10]|uniref:Uncharacterized protein n=1 Tax=Dothistroma septosporum (strain NZE10 / CBS 128990) TaxID=675120 RepID=N1PN46_DOTSN|nr:hypothetical protein DOTSEDRAFT_34800 [Dothistroma septosporum NZE10]